MTRPAKLPALSPVATGNNALDSLLRQMIERMEVREGARGDPQEKVVTHREMKALGLDSSSMGSFGMSRQSIGGGVMVQTPDGTFTRVPYDTFADELRKTSLYRDLTASIDSVNRFDDIPGEVRAILLNSIADEAAERGADIRRLESKLQSATESLAYTVQEVTASVAGAAAGIREVSFASADANRATAGKVTQVQARLDNFSDGSPGTATIEEVMKATADRTTGLGAQYTIKLKAGKAIAGFGLAATEDTAGATTSAFLIQADKFAIVSPDYNGSTTAPDIKSIPFGVNAATGQVYINGSLTINSGGDTVDTLLPATYKDYRFQRGTSSTTGPSKPIGITTGAWTDVPQQGTGYLYMTSADRKVNGDAVVGAWSDPVRMDGEAGASTQYQYLKNSSSTTAPSGTGQTEPIALSVGEFLWMRTGTTVPPATTVSSWSAYVRISGEKGATGQGMVKGICFYRGDSAPTPSGGSFSNPNAASPWSDGIPFDNNKPLWMTSQIFTSDGLPPAQGAWTTPSKVGSPSLISRPVFSVLGTVASIGSSNETWHVTPSVNDVFMATQAGVNGDFTNGAITGSVKIKGEKGDPGLPSTVPGPEGKRGTIVTKITGGWNEASANAQIASVATSAGAKPTTPIKGDIVSHVGGAKEFDPPGYPLAWGPVAAYIDGSLIVSGTIGADKIAANISLTTNGFIKASGTTSSVNYQGHTISGAFNDSLSASIGVVGVSGSGGAGVVGYGQSGGAGLQGSIAPGSSGLALYTDGPSKMQGALEVVGSIILGSGSGIVDTSGNARFAAAGHTHPVVAPVIPADYLRYSATTVGNPGTVFTHTLTITGNGITVRLPCFYP